MSSNKSKDEVQQRALKIVSVFSKDQLMFGLPSHVFGLGAVIGVITFFFLSKVMALIFLITYFRVMFVIHENDPKGFEVWKNTFYRKTKGWSATRVQTADLILIDEGRGS